jgi:cation:H+ antiporter
MALLIAATYNGRVTTVDAVVLLVAAVVVVGLIVRTGLRDRAAAAVLEAEVADFEGPGPVSLPRASLLALAGLLGTLAGAQIVVVGATGLARTLGVSEAVIGLTVVAVGTSLPELVTAVAAARRGDTDLVVGNVLGSNIFNSLPVAGVAGLLATVRLDPAFGVSLVVMGGAMLLAAVLLISGRRLTRGEGVVLLSGFAVGSALVL